MFKEILVPLDGSKNSERILPHVEHLTKLAPGKVRLVHVVGRTNDALVSGQNYLAQVQAAWREKIAELDGTVLMGSPEKEILTFAITRRCDLIALVTRAHTGLKRLIYGSCAEAILRKSSVPLYLARAHVEPRPIKRILVPVDGSSRGMRVLPLAGAIAKPVGAAVTLLQVVVSDAEKDKTAATLQSMQANLEKQELKAASIVRVGKPVAQILEAAKVEGADLIALTTHGRTGLERAWLGSVAEEVVHGSNVPVAVLRTARLTRVVRKLGTVTPRRGKRRATSGRGMMDALDRAAHSGGVGHL